MTLLSYTFPGFAVDLLLFLIRHGMLSLCAFLAGVVANVSGSALVNIIYFRLPLIPLILSLAVASLSGGLGGLVAFKVAQLVKKNNCFKNVSSSDSNQEKEQEL